jgi:hypothetical protein
MSFSYARGEISSFVRVLRDPYIACMKNRYPTYQELAAFEREARRLRTVEMARLVRAGAEAVRSLFRTKVKLKAKRLQHA